MIMDTNAIKEKIDALNAMVAADSVTPETVASILYDLLAALEDVTLPDNVVTDDDITDVVRTGDVRNSLLGGETDKPVSVALVQKLNGSGYRFMGIAGTATAPYSNPEVVGLKLFYLAVEQGTYTKFGNKVKKSAASIMVLCSSDSGATWKAEESADLSAKSNGSTVYDLTKIDALTGGSSSADVKAAFTPLSGGSSRSVPQVGDILRTNGTDYPYDNIVVYAQSTDSGEGIKSFKYLSGTVIRTIQVMPDFSAVNVTETDLAKTGYEPHVDFDLQTIQVLYGVPHLLMICNKEKILSTDEIAFFRHKKTHILNNGYKDSGNPKRKFKSGWIRSTGLCFDQSLGENIYPFGIPKSLAIKPYTIFKYDEFGKDVWELCPLESEAVVSGFEDFYDFCQFGMTRVSSEDTLTIRTGHGWMKKKITAADRVGVHRSITCGVAVYRNGKRVSDIKPFKIVFTKINKTTDGIIDKNDIKVTFRV